MLISEAKWRVRALQSLPWSSNAQKKQKSSLSETTPTEKRVHTFRAFAKAPLMMRRSREARQSPLSMLVYNNYINTRVLFLSAISQDPMITKLGPLLSADLYLRSQGIPSRVRNHISARSIIRPLVLDSQVPSGLQIWHA